MTPRSRFPLRTLLLVALFLAVAAACDDDPDAAPADAGADLAADVDGSCPPEATLWTDVDLADFAPIPDLDELDYDEVTTAEETAYWELRWALSVEDPEVLGASGTPCTDATDRDTCEAALEALRSDVGFGGSCLPGECFYYLAVTRGDSVFAVTDAAGLVAFFGAIDAPAEAFLVARAAGYDWRSSSVDAGGYAPVATDGSWRLLVTELLRDCDPVITDRVELSVSSAGAVTPQRRQHLSVSCGSCI
jgi:hypothetical protein